MTCLIKWDLIFLVVSKYVGGLPLQSSVPFRWALFILVIVSLGFLLYHSGDLSLKARYALYRYQKISHTMLERDPSVRIDELELRLEAQKLYQQKIYDLESSIKALEEGNSLLIASKREQNSVALARRFYSPSLAQRHQLMIEQISIPYLQLGQGVFLHDALVGQVVHTSDKLALVNSLSHRSSRVPVANVTGTHGAIAKGIGDDAYLELDMIEGDTSLLREGEQWLTAGDGECFPVGLKVGTLIKKNQRWYLTYTPYPFNGRWVLYQKANSG